jgi:CRP/FNR family transcriptional regulator
MLTSAHHAEPTSPWIAARSLATARAAGSALDDCFALAPVRQLKAKEPLFAEGDSKSNVYKIESGAVLIYKILNDGFRQIVNFAFPGDYVGLEMSSLYTYDAQTIAPTRIRSIPAIALWRRAREDDAVAGEIYETLSREISDARDHFLTIGRLSATGRIATFLLALAKRNERKSLDAVNIQLPVRRSDIADFLCLSVETVSRSLTELKTARIISLRGWRQIKLADLDALERFADGETMDGSGYHFKKAA